MRVSQSPPKGDEITLERGDDQLLAAIWDQIAREDSPTSRMNIAIRSCARRVPAALPSKEPI